MCPSFVEHRTRNLNEFVRVKIYILAAAGALFVDVPPALGGGGTGGAGPRLLREPPLPGGALPAPRVDWLVGPLVGVAVPDVDAFAVPLGTCPAVNK